MGDSNVHNHKRVPMFIAGHAGGALKGNMHVKAADGTPMANAMLTVAHSLGLDMPSFGDSTAALDLNKAQAPASDDRRRRGRARLRPEQEPDHATKHFAGGDCRTLRCPRCCTPRHRRRSPMRRCRATGTRSGRC